ncbi:MAG: ferritin [Porphyromonas sp.]|nr:ferritin [Porphyromonas sp.]
MKLSETVRQAINKQINAEMWSSNLYLSMSMHFKHVGYNGFAQWLFAQSREEMEHAYEMADFLNKRGGKVEIGALAAVPVDFGTPLEVFEQVYEHECKVTELIENVVRVASEARDMASQDFFWKFIREQVEEEDTAAGIVSDIKLAGEAHLTLIDQAMASRQA